MKFAFKKSKKLIFKLLFLALVGYIIFLFVNQHIRIKNKSEEAARLNEQIQIQKSKNEKIKNILDGNEEQPNSDTDPNKSGPKVRVFENAIKQ